MPAIDSLLKRLGFVKLARYGLVLTPEGRIMSLRPTILDDGLGGRIVGWPDGDLAAMELQKWEPARPAPMQAVATRVAVAPPVRPMPKPAAFIAPTAPVSAPILKPIPSLMVPVPAPKPVPVPAVAPVVAEAPQVEEDDWEWEIAIARARVAAEEAELAAASLQPVRRARGNTVPPPVVHIPAIPVVPVPTLEDFPKTETLVACDDGPIAKIVNRPVRPPAERPLATPVGVRKPIPPPAKQATLPVVQIPAPVVARTQTRPGTAPPTVIPIPKLPSIKDPTTQIQPVLSTPRRATVPTVARTRFAKGTGPVSGTHVGPPPAPALTDKTSPGLVLPATVRTVGLPKR